MRGRDKERGAVLLSTLLVMSLMAAVSVAIIDDIVFGARRVMNVQNYAQADWYVQGAEDFAQTYLEKTTKNKRGPQLRALVQAGVPIVFPIEGGQISLSLRDGSQCLSLGDMGGALGRRQFKQLLAAMGWSDNEAAHLTDLIEDWMDTDSLARPGGAEDYLYMGKSPAYRTANTAFTSVTELRALEGMSEETFQSIRPFLCARSADKETKINLNTLSLAQYPLLAAMIGGDDGVRLAKTVLAERPASGFANFEHLVGLGIIEIDDIKNLQNVSSNQITFEPKFIFARADISYNGARRSSFYEFEVKDEGLELISRRKGSENDRPLPILEPKI